MKRMTKAEAEALTAFLMRVRPEWSPAGIMAALEKASPGADVLDVARAAINIAADPTVRTPGLLPKAGAHWRTPDGVLPARRGDNNVPCPEHPEHDMPHDHGGDMTPEQIATEAARIRALITTGPKPRHPAPPKPETDLDAVRAALDTRETP